MIGFECDTGKELLPGQLSLSTASLVNLL